MAPKNRNGNGNRQRQQDDDDDDQGGGELFSDDQRTELGNLINAAVSGQLSRKLPSAIKSAVDEGMAPIRELLERNGGKRRDEGGDEGGGDDDDQDPPQRGRGRGKRRENDDDDRQEQRRGGKNPEVSKLESKIAKMEQERAAERAQLRNRERDAMLREELTAAGVDPNRMRGAIAVLRDQLIYDEKAGEWIHRTKVDGVDEDRDVSIGVKEWANTDEGKSYLAAQQPGQRQQARQGTGTRIAAGQQRAAGGGVINRGQQQTDAKTQRANDKVEAMNNLGNAVNELLGGTIPVG